MLARGGVRRLRLVGSVVIAVLAFLGLAKYTPPQVIDDIAAGKVKVARSDIVSVVKAVRSLDHELEDLAGCVQQSTPKECNQHVSNLRQHIAEVDIATRDLQNDASLSQ